MANLFERIFYCTVHLPSNCGFAVHYWVIYTLIMLKSNYDDVLCWDNVSAC